MSEGEGLVKDYEVLADSDLNFFNWLEKFVGRTTV